MMLEMLGSILCILFVDLVVIYQVVLKKKKAPESAVDKIQKHLPQLHMPQSGHPHRKSVDSEYIYIFIQDAFQVIFNFTNTKM